MVTVDEALDLIALKCPQLAATATKTKARPSERLKLKAANTLIASAIATDAFTDRQRASMAKLVSPVVDSTRSATLPAVRITQEQLRQLQADADAEGVDISSLVRRRLFGE